MDAVVDGDGPSEVSQLAAAVSVLAEYTTTSDECYFCIWEGYDDLTRSGAARINIPERGCYLFRGAAHDMSNWADGRGNVEELPATMCTLPIPAFIWPADRTWCITNDVDPHFATIGASEHAIAALLRSSGLDTTPDDPGQDPPGYGF